MAESDRLVNPALILRQDVLDQWTGRRRNQDLVQDRNALAHGGSILLDIEAIVLMF